jgi:hypothetical protein
MLRRLRSKVRLRSQTTKLASDLIADIKMTLNGHDYTDIQKKAIRCDIVRTRKKGRSVVCYDETDCVRNTNFRLDIETNILNLT